MRILGIPLMLIGLVDETQSLVRVVFSQLMCGQPVVFMACSCHPRKSEEAAQAASLQNRCQ